MLPPSVYKTSRINDKQWYDQNLYMFLHVIGWDFSTHYRLYHANMIIYLCTSIIPCLKLFQNYPFISCLTFPNAWCKQQAPLSWCEFITFHKIFSDIYQMKYILDMSQHNLAAMRKKYRPDPGTGIGSVKKTHLLRRPTSSTCTVRPSSGACV